MCVCVCVFVCVCVRACVCMPTQEWRNHRHHHYYHHHHHHHYHHHHALHLLNLLAAGDAQSERRGGALWRELHEGQSLFKCVRALHLFVLVSLCISLPLISLLLCACSWFMLVRLHICVCVVFAFLCVLHVLLVLRILLFLVLLPSFSLPPSSPPSSSPPPSFFFFFSLLFARDLTRVRFLARARDVSSWAGRRARNARGLLAIDSAEGDSTALLTG